MHSAETWGFSFASVIIVCLAGFSGVLLLPFLLNKKKRIRNERILLFLISLALGVMITDAALHLIPEGFDLHSHPTNNDKDHPSTKDSSHSAPNEKTEPHHLTGNEIILRGTILLIGVYCFFLIEKIIDLFGISHAHQAFNLTENCDSISSHSEELTNISEDKTKATDSISIEDKVSPLKVIPANSMPWYQRLTTLAWVVLVGDGFHNFIDGIAIGASFLKSVKEGIAISIAILLHEIVQEIGDYAILITNGLTKWQALLANLLSGMTSFLGVIIGLSIKEQNIAYVLLFTGGTFFYLSLNNLLQQISLVQHPNKIITFSIINGGILVGFSVILAVELFHGYYHHSSH